MMSGHYPLAWSSPYAYVIVGLVLVAGALVRHFYNIRHAGKGDPWWAWAVAAVAIWLAIWISSASAPIGRERLGLAPLPEAADAPGVAQAPRDAAEIVLARCSMCHASQPVWAGIGMAPKGVRLDTPGAIARARHDIHIHSVLTRAMPPNNITGMTLEERRVLAQWTGRR
jgi:uncharacterized membrane protein